MKTLYNLIFILPFIISCSYKPKDHETTVLRDTIFEPHSGWLDSAMVQYDEFKIIQLQLYTLTDKDNDKALSRTDSLIKVYNDKYIETKNSININILKDLHFLKGEIYYKNMSFQLALKEFSFDTIEDYDINRASTYLKLNRQIEAFSNLDNALISYSDISFGYYYEIINKIDSAKAVYGRITRDHAEENDSLYKLASTRFTELNKVKPKLMTEIPISTRRYEN